MTRFVEGLRRFGSKIIDGIGRFGASVGKVLRPVVKPALRFLRNMPGKIGKLASDGLRDIHDDEAGEEFGDLPKGFGHLVDDSGGNFGGWARNDFGGWARDYYKKNPGRVRVNQHGETEVTI